MNITVKNILSKIRKVYAPVIIFIMMCAAGCSIFDLKGPQAPIAGNVTEDPLNIGAILRVANESAADMDYRDYFAADVRFEDYVLRRIEGRDEVIRMLNRLRALTTHVEWQTERANRRIEGNRQILEDVPYIVRSGNQEIGRGLADFHIVSEPEWKINYWKDTPVGLPFFDPF